MLYFKLVVASLCVMSVYASGYGGYGGAAKSGGFGAMGFSGGFGNGRSAGSVSGQVIPAAIHTRHNIEYLDVPSTGSVTPTVVDVGSNSVPLHIMFRSTSSALNVQHEHNGGGGGTQETQSEDEPHRLIHSVRKPIIQEVYEVITPFRKITQEIQPVQEEIQTIVARGNGQAAGLNGLAGFSAGYSGAGKSALKGGY